MCVSSNRIEMSILALENKACENFMFIDVVTVVLFVLINLFDRVSCASIDLIRYHANLYRCGEVIIDEDLIRPLYFYFVFIKPEEHHNINDLSPVLYSLARIEKACQTAYSISNEEMRSPSILYSGFKWLKRTLGSR